VSRGAERVLVMARQRTVDQDPAVVLRMLVDVEEAATAGLPDRLGLGGHPLG